MLALYLYGSLFSNQNEELKISTINRKLAVIFATDVVGYSKQMEKNESESVKTLRACENILKDLFKKYEGRLFNSGGDSFFAEFPSAVSAVECASAFQERLNEFYSQNDLPIKLQFRVGIHMGDVIKEKRNLLGDGVNIAARLEALAQPSGVTISKAIFDLVEGKVNLSFNDLGLQTVKENQFHAYDVLLSKSQRRTLKKSTKPKLRFLGSIAAIFIAVVIGIILYIQSQTTPIVKTRLLPMDKPAILVIPFENQTGKSDNDFIGFGITSNIISTLSINDSILVSSSSTGKYIQERNFSDDEIKANYGIQYLLRGDVQGAEGAYRITLQMSDLKKSEVVWSKLFDFKELKELFSIQDKISLAILEQLSVKTRGSQLSDVSYFTNPEAYRNYLNAWSAFSLKTVEGSEKAEKLWKKAMELDPDHRRLNFMMAWVHWRKVTMRVSDDPKKDMEKAYTIALNTIEEFPEWTTPKALAGLIELFLKKYDGACSRIPTLINEAKDHSDLAMANLVIHSCGSLEEAIENYEKIMLASPHHQAWIFYMYNHALIENRQYEKAESFTLTKLNEKHNWSGVDQTLYLQLAYLYELKGSKKKAQKMFDLHKSIDGKGKTGEIIHKEYITARDKTYLNELIAALKPYGLSEK